MTNQLLVGVVIVPAIIGLVQVFKQAGLPTRFAPVLAVAFGILAGLAQSAAGRLPWIGAVVIGIALGLSAVGLYSATTASLLPALSGSNPPSTPAPPATT